ncbi:MAG: DNA repair protein RecN [Lachnospiraceae bacterium]|nr:DNA repair protein RecN [Lachnospiraceae bacterium]
MLMHLHVKNFALIEEADMEFGAGLNILTGETGAGKSILIDAVNLALGGKAGSNVIRAGAEYAYVELVFQIDEESKKQQLRDLDIETEDGVLILSRKIQKGRSIFRINDETVTAARVRRMTGLLIDIHGQHEHQSLLYKYRHLEILDAYAGQEIFPVKEKLSTAYNEYVQQSRKLHTFSMEEEVRLREVDFLRFEINEIVSACLKDGEEEELEQVYKRISNSRNIMESMAAVRDALGYDSSSAAGESVSRAVKEIQNVLRYDDSVCHISDQIQDLESILSDINHDVAEYMDSLSFDQETYEEVRERLDLIRSLQAKYGRDYSQIMESLRDKQERLQELENYEENRRETLKACDRAKKRVLCLCEQLSLIRKKAAVPLVQAITESLKELNFLQVSFDMHFERSGQFGSNGYDDAEFVISTNPGQPMQPLGDVASGGELSRIMLAVKSVLADTDQIPTLIFDEIDTGISGRTAACVSEKLSWIGQTHQVLCITHLPQIASMADNHFMIEKDIVDEKTRTTISHLEEEESVRELARLLGGVQITDAVLRNARELKAMKTQLLSHHN